MRDGVHLNILAGKIKNELSNYYFRQGYTCNIKISPADMLIRLLCTFLELRAPSSKVDSSCHLRHVICILPKSQLAWPTLAVHPVSPFIQNTRPSSFYPPTPTSRTRHPYPYLHPVLFRSPFRHGRRLEITTENPSIPRASHHLQARPISRQ